MAGDGKLKLGNRGRSLCNHIIMSDWEYWCFTMCWKCSYLLWKLCVVKTKMGWQNQSSQIPATLITDRTWKNLDDGREKWSVRWVCLCQSMSAGGKGKGRGFGLL